MMDALEVGRVNVAARGVGIAQRALELALRYSQERKTFGKPIAQHQAIQFKLADMATKVEAARLLTMKAARMKDAGERSDLEAGMAKLLASETGKEVVEEAFRIHGGYGYSKEYEIERLYRDAPAAADRRGHLRDPAHGDRQEAAREAQDLSSGRARQRRESRDRAGDRPAACRGARLPGLRRAPAIPADVERARRAISAIQLDVTDQASVDAAREQIEADPGRLDALVNNAGVHGDPIGVADYDLDLAHEVLEVNTFGPWRLTQAFVPLLRGSGHPRVVNVSSGAGQLSDMNGGRAAYRVSKAALNALTRTLASDERWLKVNTMCPGWVRTDMGGRAAPRSVEEGADTAVWLATVARRRAQRRLLPRPQAHPVVRLC